MNKSNRTEVLDGWTKSTGFDGASGTCPRVWTSSTFFEDRLSPWALEHEACILQYIYKREYYMLKYLVEVYQEEKNAFFGSFFSPFLCSSSYDVIGEEILEILETKEDLWQRKSRTRKLTCKLSHISNSWYESRSSFFPATKFPWAGRTWRDGR